MKFITLVLIVFLSLGMINSFAIIVEVYPSDITLTGNFSEHSSGSYGGHSPAITENGFFRSVNANCASSDDMCFGAYYGAGKVTINYYNLQGAPPPSLPFFCKTISLDSNGFHQTVSLLPCN